MSTKSLIVYYSRRGENYWKGEIRNLERGNSEIAAEFIQNAVGGDLFHVETVKPYAAGYKECCAQAQIEWKENARPEIREFLESIDEYETIFLVFPCWYGTLPMCMFTFLDHYNLSGKKLAPLCSNEGSGMGKSERDLSARYPTAEILTGLSVQGHNTLSSAERIADWAKRLV